MVPEGHGSPDEDLSEQSEDLTEKKKSISVALLETVGKQAFYSEWDWKKGQMY